MRAGCLAFGAHLKIQMFCQQELTSDGNTVATEIATRIEPMPLTHKLTAPSRLSCSLQSQGDIKLGDSAMMKQAAILSHKPRLPLRKCRTRFHESSVKRYAVIDAGRMCLPQLNL